jgi:large subunit ribosomal protein L22
MATSTKLAAAGIPTTGKTNERPGTRAVVRHVRMSATKARVVLDLIRGKDVQTADEILKFSERDAAIVIRKLLHSAVSNAEHNDEQIVDDLYVSACFADEGKTLRRFRPRARGRATRIRKRTCHITIIVSRLPEQELARKRAKDAQRPGSRAARVAGQQLEQQGRRRRRRNRNAAAEHDHDHVEGPAEEVGAVDTTEPVLEAMEAEDAAIDEAAGTAGATEAETEGIVDTTEAAVEAVEDINEAAADASDDTSPEGPAPSDSEEGEK